MSAAHVRRGGTGRARPRKSGSKVTVPKRIAKRLPVTQARANKLAGLTFAGFLLAIAVVVLVALDVPAKAQRSAGAAVGRAGFVVSGYQIVGLDHMDRARIDRVVNESSATRTVCRGRAAPAASFGCALRASSRPLSTTTMRPSSRTAVPWKCAEAPICLGTS